MAIEELKADVLAQLQVACEALEDKKALEVKILHVGAVSSITDYFIIASGNSVPHLKALGIAVEKAFKEKKVKVLGIESDPQSGWIVLDAFDMMVHLFLPEMRADYSLDVLWKDAEEIALADIAKQ